MQMQEFIDRSHLDLPTLNVWIEAEWLVPIATKRRLDFSDAELARVRLIQDLKADFGVNDEGISIILHLLDQLHGLRCLVQDIQIMGTLDRTKHGD